MSTIRVDNIANAQGTSAIDIDSSGNIILDGPRKIGVTGYTDSIVLSSTGGYVLKPQNPVFRANITAGTTFTSGWNDVVYDISVTQRGNGYNSANGRFTAPVDGWYQFNAQLTCNNNSDNDGTLSICRNNSTVDLFGSVSQSNTGGTSIEGVSVSGCGYLNAGDYVVMKRYFSVANVASRSHQAYGGWFTGFLIG